MAIPDYQTVMLPLLKQVALKGPTKIRDARLVLADEFKLTDSERAALLPSGKQPVFDNRVGWASTYLRKAGLLRDPRRGVMEITERGLAVLAENPQTINVKYLEQFEEFIAFRDGGRGDESETGASLSSNNPRPEHGTPEEVLEEAHAELRNQVLDDIVDRIKLSSPQFFEELVVDLIVKMGYGGSRIDAGKAVGKSGDEGIDGIINEDRLGLDVIYLQAKRWQGNVSRPEVQKFTGALQGKRAKKGILITTSDFTSEAREFVKNIDTKIILISGRQLAELMWEFNLGLGIIGNYEVKKLDLDYFSE
jgi:restriction system protein